MADLLHDLYAYKNGSDDDHARPCADHVRKLSEKPTIMTPGEKGAICAAIRRHDSKAEVDGPIIST